MIKKLILLIPLALFSCIGEDIIQDRIPVSIRFTNPLVSLKIGTQFQFNYTAFDEVGQEVEVESITWNSSETSILTIDQLGNADALDYGEVMVTVRAVVNGLEIVDDLTFSVGDETVKSSARFGTIQSTSSYELEGMFDFSLEGDNLIISIDESYVADDGLPGLYVYLTNNPNTVANSYEIGAVTKFAGSHSYEISDVHLFQYSYLLYYCKPFNVKVGDGEIMDQ